MKTVATEECTCGTVPQVRLVNTSGAAVTLGGIGAAIMAVEVPDRNGKLADVTIGYADTADYMADGPAAGKIPGRYANRIAKGHFTLDGTEYTLPINNGPNSLHGGPEGFHNQIWKLLDSSDDTALFEYVSADGEMGYPGTLTARALYRWTDSNELQLTLTATTDKPTVVNLTNHAYWNLAGHDSGCVLAHELELRARCYLPTDPFLVPTGELAPVEGTPMDFTTPKTIGRDIKEPFDALKFGKGYDNCWVLPHKEGIQLAARLTEAGSGRTLEVLTDQPAVQVYTGNWLSGCPKGKNGAEYHDYDAVAIECQNYPDAPNRPDFPDSTLRPGQTYCRNIVYRFGIERK